MRAFPWMGLLVLLAASPVLAQVEPDKPVHHIQISPDQNSLTSLTEVDRWQEKLKTSKANLDVQDLPLAEAAQLLSAQLDIPIRFHNRGLEDVGLGLDTPVNFQLAEVSGETLLRLLLKQYDLTYVIEAEGIVFTTPEEAEQNVLARFYNIDGIIPGPNRDYDSIVYMVSSIIEPESWDEGTGPSSIVGYENGIILRQTLEVHQKIDALLSVLRETKNLPAEDYQTKAMIASPSGLASTAILEKLQRTKVNLEADQLPLSEVAQLLEKRTSVPFYIDQRALEDIGISPELFVDLSLHDVSVHHALNVIAEQFHLAWLTFGEVVIITTPEEAEIDLEVRVYPVRDLTWNGLNPADPEVRKLLDAASEYFPKYFGGGFSNGGWNHSFRVWDIPELPSRIDDLVEAIYCNVEPNSWGNLGGPGGIVYFPAADCLIVSQSQKAHQQIATLLQTIRNHQKPLDPSELAQKLDQADETVLVMFYRVPRDRDGKPKFTPDELKSISVRMRLLFGKGTWNQDSHFIDVTQSVVIVRHRRDIQRQIAEFWSHLGPDESKLFPQQNSGHQPHGGFGNNVSSEPVPQPAEDGSPPTSQQGGFF